MDCLNNVCAHLVRTIYKYEIISKIRLIKFY